MWNETSDLLPKLTAGAVAALILVFAPTLDPRPAVAEEEAIDSEVIVRPMVVVRTGDDDAGFTWAFSGQRAFLGVQTVALTAELREHFGVPTAAGVLVAKVVEDSPAAGTDLEVGDIISAVDGEPVDSPSALARVIGGHESGDVVDLEVWRESTVRSLQVTLVEHEAPSVDIRQFRFPRAHAEAWRWQDDELENVIELETETLNRAIERLNEELDNPEWHARIHSFREHQGTLMKRIEMLETRLRQMEEELRRLEEEKRP